MKKLLLSFAMLLITAGAWAQTDVIKASTNTSEPEYIYYIMCNNSYGGNKYYMNQYSGPASSKEKANRFAFFAGTQEGDYKIYSVDAQKWLSYTASNADNTWAFASLEDNQESAQVWKASLAKENTVYQFQPYNTSGETYASYMNWNGGVEPVANTHYRLDQEETVGVWRNGADNDGGSAWIIEEIIQGVDAAKEELSAWESSIPVGTKVGEYTKNESAYAEAMVELEAAVGVDEINAALEKCKAAYVLNMLEVGKYYRIKNTKHSTYTGLDGYTLNMKNFAEDLTNPTMIWKYEQEGEQFFMKNVFAALYPQAVPSGGSATTKVGKGKEKAFTYALHAPAVKNVADAQWNIFFGGTQVNIEENGNVNYWYADGAHHNLYEVEATDVELATMCMNWYNANKYVAPEATASSYQKIAIDPSATEIISPSEFAAPSVINEAIDNLAAIEGTLGMEITSAGDIHTLFGALSVYAPAVNALTAYKNAVTAHGELLSIAYTPKAEWGTIILPINWANPDGWTRYSCTSTEGNMLVLTELASGANKNTPMIVSVPEEKIGTTYQMIGYSNGAGTENVASGLLTGVLEDNTFVPEGSYVLSKYNDKIGFYPVSAGTSYEASKYKCYLTLPAASARYNALYFDETETGIIETEGENAEAEIYDMSGRRVQKAHKGLYIVNGVKVIK